MAPWPAIRLLPGLGAATTRVRPSTRLTGISVERGLIASATSKAAVMRSSWLCASSVSSTAFTSTRPIWEYESNRPGVTTWPWASIRRTEAGRGTEAPTARILPFSITTVPFWIVPCGPIVWRVAPVIATVSALAAVAPASARPAMKGQSRPRSHGCTSSRLSRMPSSKSVFSCRDGSLRSKARAPSM